MGKRGGEDGREGMLLLAMEEWEERAEKLAALPPFPKLGRLHAGQFQNGEWWVKVETPVNGEACVLLGSIAPPDGNLLALLLAAHTLKKDGAARVTALLPYLAYTRQDKNKPGESLSAAWTGKALKSAGIDAVLTVDVHSRRAQGLYPMPLVSISPAPLFAGVVKGWGWSTATLVAPDQGARERCRAVRRELCAGGSGDDDEGIAWFEKERANGQIRHTRLNGQVRERAILVDDMLDTGATLVSACEELRAAGVSEMRVLVTHGLFTGEGWQALWQRGVQRIVSTDTVPTAAKQEDERIEIVPVAELLRQQLSALASEPA